MCESFPYPDGCDGLDMDFEKRTPVSTRFIYSDHNVDMEGVGLPIPDPKPNFVIEYDSDDFIVNIIKVE